MEMGDGKVGGLFIYVRVWVGGQGGRVSYFFSFYDVVNFSFMAST